MTDNGMATLTCEQLIEVLRTYDPAEPVEINLRLSNGNGYRVPVDTVSELTRELDGEPTTRSVLICADNVTPIRS